ncbi:O-antigen ligase family protein [Photobacterium damselae]
MTISKNIYFLGLISGGFLSFNFVGFNPVYIYMVFLMALNLLFFFEEGNYRIKKYTLIMMLIAILLLVIQMLGVSFNKKEIMYYGNTNFITILIFIISILYSLFCIEFYFKNKQMIDLKILYSNLSKFLFTFFLIELLTRILNGNPSLGIIYGFKDSFLFFDSNFTSLVLLSFFNYYQYLHNKRRYNGRLIRFSLFVFICLTFSRAAIFTVILSYLIFYKDKNAIWKAYICLCLYLIVFFILSYLYVFDSFSFLNIDGSFNSKFYIVDVAIFIYEKLNFWSLLFGIGLGNFSNYTNIFAHNIFVTIIIEFGLIGFSLFVIVIFYTCKITKNGAIYIWLSVFICGLSLFGSYSPYVFITIALIYIEEVNERFKKNICNNTNI